jgi:hypothetical protein
MIEAVRTSETSVDNNFTQQYIPEDNSEHHTHHRENLKSHIVYSSQLHCPENSYILVGVWCKLIKLKDLCIFPLSVHKETDH